MSLIRNLTTKFTSSSDTVEHTSETSEDGIDVWSPWAFEFHYCELCGQVFSTWDVFDTHREDSAYEIATPDDENAEYDHYRELKPGDEFPDGATIGKQEPCDINRVI